MSRLSMASAAALAVATMVCPVRAAVSGNGVVPASPVAEKTGSAARLLLPTPVDAPMDIDFANDPILRLGRQSGGDEAFRQVVADAVRRHPGLREAEASYGEAQAERGGAKAALMPSIELNVIGDRALARDFSSTADTLIERSRPRGRTDATASVEQTLFDFGASSRRIEAASARLRAANAGVDAAADEVALRVVDAWYRVYAYRALVELTDSMVEGQRGLVEAVRERVRQGVAAEGDVPRVEAFVATAETRGARFRRSLAQAEARLAELTGAPVPVHLERPSFAGQLPGSLDAVSLAAANIPEVRSAEQRAQAARLDARATRADMLPRLSASVDASRYGVFETDNDYDVRGRLVLRQRFFGGLDSRADQAGARASLAQATADRVREEAARDARIAFSDVAALQAELSADERAYVAHRRSRDVLAERFRVARGTLFDVINAENEYFEAAASYVQAVAELDAARFVLLSRTGRLLDSFGIDPSRESRS